jgi:hypothetical protein
VLHGQFLADAGSHIDETSLDLSHRKRGEYVEFGLPHHCHGGERYRVSRNGKTRVMIKVD